MSGAREAVLARVRAALGPAPEIAEVPRAYREAGALGAGAPAGKAMANDHSKPSP